ncbi:hypothetical protein BH18CHL2_BH18CHL2_13060 [soil metagenome]
MRSVIDADRSASILDVADRIAAAPAGHDLVLLCAVGAPWLRSAVFIEVARGLAGSRRFAIVTSDARARSLAAGVHVPAYASLAALDRDELDATERLERRPGGPASREFRPARLRPPLVTGRGVAAAASLTAALALLLAVLVPEVTVVVSPTTQAIGPLELQLRAGPGGEIARTDLSDTITASVHGTATGSREEQIKATGAVLLQNAQTLEARIPRGTAFRTPDGVRFLSTEDRVLPRSIIIIPPLAITLGQVEVPVEAAQPGASGNVPAGRISVSPSPGDYTVTNRQPTAGGQVKKIPIVKKEDHARAAGQAPEKLQEAAEARLARWRTESRPGFYVVPRVYSKVTSVTSEAEVVDKEVESFDIAVTGVATSFAVADGEPSRTAVQRLRALERDGYALDASSARIEAALLDDPTGTGVTAWRVTAAGVQLARVDSDRLRRTLAGRALDEVAPVLEGEGVRLVEIRPEPAWWPRVPLLDMRIRLSEVPAAALAR